MAIFISALISDPSRRYRPRALARGRYRRQGSDVRDDMKIAMR